MYQQPILGRGASISPGAFPAFQTSGSEPKSSDSGATLQSALAAAAAAYPGAKRPSSVGCTPSTTKPSFVVLPRADRPPRGRRSGSAGSAPKPAPEDAAMSGARGPSGSAGSYGPMKEYIVHSPENQSAQGERGAHRTSSRGPSLPYADDSRGELVARRAKRELSIDYAGDIPVPTGGLSPPGPGPSGAVDQDGDVLMAMMDVEINNATSYAQQMSNTTRPTCLHPQ